MAKLDEQVFSLLKDSGKPLTLPEIAEQMGKSPKPIFRALRKLFEEGKIDCDAKTRQYTVAKEK